MLTGVVALVVLVSIVSDLKKLNKNKENCCVRPITYNKFLLLSMLIIAMILNNIITH